MAQRLVEKFKIGDLVEVDLSRISGSTNAWVPGIVVGFDAPGMWVDLVTGQRFFVTNTRKIRPKITHPTPNN